MIKVYGMNTCPDCIAIKAQIEKRNDEFEYIEIGSNVKLLKEFIKIRDNNSIFDEIKKEGSLGIPCFVLEDGSISLNPTDFGLDVSSDKDFKKSCSLNDKSGC